MWGGSEHSRHVRSSVEIAGSRRGSAFVTHDSPWWICPAGTGRCCVWLGRPRARCDTVKPGSLSRARKSFHLRPGGQEERGQRVKASHKQRLQIQTDLRWIQSQNSAKSADLSTRATQNKWAKLFSLEGLMFLGTHDLNGISYLCIVCAGWSPPSSAHFLSFQVTNRQLTNWKLLNRRLEANTKPTDSLSDDEHTSKQKKLWA